jgi:hypothetical protein
VAVEAPHPTLQHRLSVKRQLIEVEGRKTKYGKGEEEGGKREEGGGRREEAGGRKVEGGRTEKG